MKINENLNIIGTVELILENVFTGKKMVAKTHNLITTAGKTSMASALRGVTTNNQGIITYCAVGSDTTVPDVANTTLGAEISRKLISVSSSSANEVLFETFFSTSEGNGSLREAGLFGDDATSLADSGTLFCHTAINRDKTSSETLTIRWTVKIG